MSAFMSLQRSVDFYQKMFGFSVVSQDQAGGIIRLGNTKVLVSLNHGGPAGIVDHFAIGVPRFGRESAALFDAARRQSSAGRLCRFAHQGSRRDKRTNFSEGLSNERAA
jgi:catechol 2,3-dioxygenase-like lactoylglutathione lyase family enzyme